MSHPWMLSRNLTAVGLLMLALLPVVAADPPSPIPSADAVADLLQREPVTQLTWPTWRTRLRGWLGDKSQATETAFEAGRNFVKGQADATGALTPPLADDPFAWYMLGRAWLDAGKTTPEEHATNAVKAEKALRRSIQMDGSLAQAHRNLALVIFLQEPPIDPKNPPPIRPPITPRRAEAQRELAAAHAADPSLSLKWVEAQGALAQNCFPEAFKLFLAALNEEPDQVAFARAAAIAVVQDPRSTGTRSPLVQPLVDRFPNDGQLAVFNALALARDDNLRGAVGEFNRARKLGTDPAQVLNGDLVEEIEAAAAPGLLEQFAWVMAGFAVFYAVVMTLMALAGFILARRTRGTAALDLVAAGDDLVAGGQVVRARHESSLARFYALALFAALILFYVSIPFVLAGLLASTALLLYLIFSLPRIPIKLIVVVVLLGLGGVWAVLKSLFASPGRGGFGLPKTPEECPKLYQALIDVAGKVDTDPVDAVYLAPGSSIGVHQEGRGPFGVFGVKRRVLTLGMSTMHFLTIGELKSILAHEYAHFSHADTFYNRFIYQINLSIQGALQGMGATGGKLNYVNPFYWFLYLYYRAYNLLSAGFSRSREFLADRMAATLYGPDVFTRALTKVSTDGALFEMTMYGNIGKLLDENKSFINMYDAFRNIRDQQMDEKDREQLYQKLLDEKESLFASHPTFRERIDAVAELPKGQSAESQSALELFDNKEELEKELTDFLTGYVHHMRQLAAQAAAHR